MPLCMYPLPLQAVWPGTGLTMLELDPSGLRDTASFCVSNSCLAFPTYCLFVHSEGFSAAELLSEGIEAFRVIPEHRIHF